MEELKKITIDSPDKSMFALPVQTTLYQVYMDGWWITEIFGSKAILVRPRKRNKDGFGLCERQVNVDQISPEAMMFIINFADQQWKQYAKRMLTYKFGHPTIEQTKQRKSNENQIMPTVPPTITTEKTIQRYTTKVILPEKQR